MKEELELILKNCDNEPINFINSIQEFGFILIVDQDNLKICQVSANVETFIPYKISDILQKKLTDFLTETSIKIIEELRFKLQENSVTMRVIQFKNFEKSFSILSRKYKSYYFFEFEPNEISDSSGIETRLISEFSDRIESTRNYSDFGSIVANSIAEISGFDRVMIYKFDDLWSGQVIAERLKNDSHSFLNHKFPSSDIPEPARRLFLNIWVRTIPNVKYKPQPLLPEKILDEKNLEMDLTDLGDSILRAVSPIHLEYLNNMLVQATMTISLKHNNNLWGLIACHNETPKYINAQTRSYCEIVGKIASAYIPTIYNREKIELESISNSKHRDVEKIIENSEASVVNTLKTVKIKLFELLDACGFILTDSSGDILVSEGQIPTDEVIRSILEKLQDKTANDIVPCYNLKKYLDGQDQNFSGIAGFLALRTNRIKYGYLIFFRKEHYHEIVWAGEPLKYPLQKGTEPVRLHPRISFESWKSIIKNQCKYWNEVDLSIAEKLIDDFLYLESRHNYQIEKKLRIDTYKMMSQLAVEKQRVDEANTSKSLFLATMSHEIRTPAGAILGYIDLVKKQIPKNPQVIKYLNTIDRNSVQLLNLIDDILDLSKVEAGKLIIENIDFNFSELLQDTISLMKIRAGEKGLFFKVHQSISVPQIMHADPTRLRQLIYNALSNAVKFTLKGQVEIYFDYDQNQQLLICRISDSGIGITKAAQQKLFSPFQQADSSTTRNFGGTGLGLVLSKKIAQVMGGDYWLEQSEVGVGSTFKFSIQVKIPKDLTSKHIFNINHDVNFPYDTKLVSNLKILIVDDSEDTLDLFMHYMSEWGVQAQTAKNGLEAVKLVSERSFDIILMDIQMPIMDGYQAVEEIRKLNTKVPIIALTAHALKQEKEHCISLGFSDYLSKPVKPTVILKKIIEFAQPK